MAAWGKCLNSNTLLWSSRLMKLTSFLLAFTLVSTSALPAFADGEFDK